MTGREEAAAPPLVIGRYALYGVLSSGGMATVHVGKLMGQAGFVRTVAIKRLRPVYARDPDFVAMFVDEARLVGRIRHPNVVPTLDVVVEGGEIFLVLEYVHGESLSYLLRRTVVAKETVPPEIAVSIFAGVLHGLHAAHEASHPTRGPLGIVHRDVSPQNILVGVDGTARVLDFGVAKALHRLHVTQQGTVKGKVRYMSPEQLLGEEVTRRSDVYAAAVVLWETLAARPLFLGETEQETREKVLLDVVRPPSDLVPASEKTLDHTAWRMLKALDAVVLRGLARDPADRFATARDFARALEAAGEAAATSVVGGWVERLAAEALAGRAARLAEAGDRVPSSDPPAGDVRDEAANLASSAPRASSTPEPDASKSAPRASELAHARGPLSAVWIAIAAGTGAVFLMLAVAAVLLLRR